MDAPLLTIERAKMLRRRLTPPEVKLWPAVRRRKLGVHFRRQHPVGPWTLDFYCHALGLAVEIDGACHDNPDRLARDRRRALWLEKRGISTFRIPGRSVLGNLDGVLEGLAARLARGPSTALRAVPLPQGGRIALSHKPPAPPPSPPPA